jgi:phosphoribosyl-AMP cyclohydrolase
MTDVLSHAGFVAAVQFDDKGLVPVIAQSHATGQVLMFAWMNRQTLEHTLASGEVTYWSRSRGKIWKKGETIPSAWSRHLWTATATCCCSRWTSWVRPATPARLPASFAN